MEKLNDARKPKHQLTKKGEETRSRIVSAAAKLMFEKGILVQAWGCVKGSLNQLVPSIPLFNGEARAGKKHHETKINVFSVLHYERVINNYYLGVLVDV